MCFTTLIYLEAGFRGSILTLSFYNKHFANKNELCRTNERTLVNQAIQIVNTGNFLHLTVLSQSLKNDITINIVSRCSIQVQWSLILLSAIIKLKTLCKLYCPCNQTAALPKYTILVRKMPLSGEYKMLFNSKLNVNKQVFMSFSLK